MTDTRLAVLLQDAEMHMRQMTCRERYERATSRLPDSRRNIRRESENRWIDRDA